MARMFDIQIATWVRAQIVHETLWVLLHLHMQAPALSYLSDWARL